ncbi:MAG TPA: metal-dependent transcriptional regulator [Ktedonobacterales bacterium]|jgi:DtxR family Mn-dependent transcriptional regulator|nr:metal-dependent transcriptional regulator [Ktedonobacterales bacterium]
MEHSTTATAKTEEYLEAIYNMSMEGDAVIGARLAEKFRVAPPTVTETLKRLVRDGLVEMDQRRQVTLTSKGVELAEAVLRRHRLTERFLVDMLGMQWHQVHEEACRLEHYISGAVEERVVTSLHSPTTCPHGNPIPGYVPNARTYLQDKGAIRLLYAQPRQEVSLLLVSEVVEDEEAMIAYLHDRGITPGTHLTLLSTSEGEGEEPMATLDVNGSAVTIPSRVAYALWIVPA